MDAWDNPGPDGFSTNQMAGAMKPNVYVGVPRNREMTDDEKRKMVSVLRSIHDPAQVPPGMMEVWNLIHRSKVGG